MITLKYAKSGSAVFISHIDVLRATVRIMRRAKFDVGFSQGFNPHMLLYFSPPLAVGVKSVCEYVTADVNGVTPADFLNGFNKSAPDGFDGVAAFYTEKLPNLAGRTVLADYFIPVPETEKISRLLGVFTDCAEYVISYIQKGVKTSKDVAAMIKGVKAVDGGVVFSLATGNENLRADRFLQNLKRDFGLSASVLDIEKKAQYVLTEKGLIEADTYLRGFDEKIIAD